VLFAANDAYLPNPESAVHTFCHALPGTWHQMGVILSATDSLNWLCEVTGKERRRPDRRTRRDSLKAPTASPSSPTCRASARRTTTPSSAAPSPGSAMNRVGAR
jgi:sugar (pentulose or hexulose) kinase